MKRFLWLISLTTLVFLPGCFTLGQESSPFLTEPLVATSATLSLPTKTAQITPTLQLAATKVTTLTPTPLPSPTRTARATATPQPTPLASAQVAEFFQLAWSPSGERIALTTRRGLYLFDVNLSQIALKPPVQELTHLAFSPDGRQLATADGMNYRVWESATGELLQDQFYTINEIRGLAYDYAGNFYIARSEGTGQDVGLAQLSDGKLVNSAFILDAPIPLLVISPTGDTWATPSGGVQILATAYRDEPLRILGDGVLNKPYDFVYHPTGQYLAVSDASCDVRIFEISTGEIVQTLTWCEEPTPSDGLAYSADGQWLAANNGAGAVLIWEVETGELFQRIRVPKGGRSGLAFSPDGSRLAIISKDNVLRVWAVEPPKN